MLETINIYILPFLVTVSAALYLQSKLLNKKIDVKKLSSYFYILSFILIGIINVKLVDNFLRFIVITIIIGYFSSLIFKEPLYKTLVSSLIQQFLLFISEVICMVLLSIFSINILNFASNDSLNLVLINIIISIIAIFLYNIKFVSSICFKIMGFLSEFSSFLKYFVIIIFLFTLNILLMTIYKFDNNIIIIWLNVSFIIIYSVIIYFFLDEKNKNDIYAKENKSLIENLSEYEKMLDYQRVNNHENKNQLLVIKSMVEKKDNKIIDYINEIIKDKREDNEVLYTKAKRIPSGGLQGLIYQKMLLMQDKSINTILDVSTNVRKIDLLNISPKMNYDICRIVGIILDNAIEELEKMNKKDREILISMYIDDYFNIEISNHFAGGIEIDKIFNKGYTTKSSGHGYGLTLLRKIVDNNDRITNEVKIIDNLFIQVIKIKM